MLKIMHNKERVMQLHYYIEVVDIWTFAWTRYPYCRFPLVIFGYPVVTLYGRANEITYIWIEVNQ